MEFNDFLKVVAQVMQYVTAGAAFILPKLSELYVQYPTLSSFILLYIVAFILYKMFITHIIFLFKWIVRIAIAVAAIYVYNRGVSNFAHDDFPYLKSLFFENKGQAITLLKACFRFGMATIPASQRIVIVKSLETIELSMSNVYKDTMTNFKTVLQAIKT